MTAEGRASVMIDVILDERNVIACVHFAQRVQEQSITRKIVNHGVAQTHAFRRSVLDVAHVEIKAPAVQQEPTVARWFFVIAIMQVESARARLPENVIFDTRRPGFG